MDTPVVSVILATHNGSHYIGEAIDSILVQDHESLELIIIDDASTDNTADILQEYSEKDNRIKVFHNEKNMERSWSKNFGVSEARGAYIAFIDDDDVWRHDKLSRQVDFLDSHGDVGILGTFARFVDEQGGELAITTHLQTEDGKIRKNILLTNQFIHSSVIMRRDIFLSCNGFDTSMNLCEDYDLWLRIMMHANAANVALPLVDYRVRITSTTARHIYRMKLVSLNLTFTYHRYFPGFVRSIIIRIATLLIPTQVLFRIREYMNKHSLK